MTVFKHKSILSIAFAIFSLTIGEIYSMNYAEIPCARLSLDATYMSIQNQNYDDAYNSFIEAININDKTLGGFAFEMIIKGLLTFGYLDDIKIEDYGISDLSIDRLKGINKGSYINVFTAINSIIYDDEKFGDLSIDECFESIKQSQEPSPIQSSDDLQQGNDGLHEGMSFDEDNLSPIEKIEDSNMTNSDTSSVSKTALRPEIDVSPTKKPKAIKRSKGDVELTKPKKMIAKDINSQNIVGKCKTGATNVGHETRKRMKYSCEDGDSIVLPAKRKKEYT